jgi:hypothetical protein
MRWGKAFSISDLSQAHASIVSALPPVSMKQTIFLGISPLLCSFDYEICFGCISLLLAFYGQTILYMEGSKG